MSGETVRGDTRKPREPDAFAACVNCAAPLVRRRNEANWNFLRRSACSRRCAAQRSAGTAKAYRPKNCRRCDRRFTPHGSHVMYCAKCAKNKPTASRKHYLLKVIEAPLEPADYDRLVAAQGRGCAVCQRHKPLHLHRPNANGPVKGMLCSKCIRATELITTAIAGRFATYMRSNWPTPAPVPTTLPPHNGTDTSAAAAESMKSLAPTLRDRVLSSIRGRHSEGMTCDEAEVALGLTHQTCSARFNELVDLCAIFDVGRRKTRSGRMAKVYVART